MSDSFRIFCPACVRSGGQQFYEADDNRPILEFDADSQLIHCDTCSTNFVVSSFLIEDLETQHVISNKEDREEDYWIYKWWFAWQRIGKQLFA